MPSPWPADDTGCLDMPWCFLRSLPNLCEQVQTCSFWVFCCLGPEQLRQVQFEDLALCVLMAHRLGTPGDVMVQFRGSSSNSSFQAPSLPFSTCVDTLTSLLPTLQNSCTGHLTNLCRHGRKSSFFLNADRLHEAGIQEWACQLDVICSCYVEDWRALFDTVPPNAKHMAPKSTNLVLRR